MKKIKKYQWLIIVILIIIDFIIVNLWSIGASMVYTILCLLAYGIFEPTEKRTLSFEF
jgi:hypothetical protein